MEKDNSTNKRQIPEVVFKISVFELLQILEKLKNDILSRYSEDSFIGIHEDMYWNIPDPKLYDVLTEPSEFTIGQLEEDWLKLKKLIQDSDRVVLPSDFGYLAIILRYLSSSAHLNDWIDARS
jgi:hypothetical protein